MLLEINKPSHNSTRVAYSTPIHVYMALSILYWLNFVSGTKKLHQKFVLAVKSDHILKFVYEAKLNHVQGRVQASMRDTSYHVNVRMKCYDI